MMHGQKNIKKGVSVYTNLSQLQVSASSS